MRVSLRCQPWPSSILHWTGLQRALRAESYACGCRLCGDTRKKLESACVALFALSFWSIASPPLRRNATHCEEILRHAKVEFKLSILCMQGNCTRYIAEVIGWYGRYSRIKTYLHINSRGCCLRYWMASLPASALSTKFPWLTAVDNAADLGGRMCVGDLKGCSTILAQSVAAPKILARPGSDGSARPSLLMNLSVLLQITRF